MAWQADFSSREELDAASAPAGVDPAAFNAARQAARSLLDSGHVASAAAHPEYAKVEREHNGRPYAHLPEGPGNAPTPPRPQAIVRVRLGGHEGDPASLSVSVSQA